MGRRGRTEPDLGLWPKNDHCFRAFRAGVPKLGATGYFLEGHGVLFQGQ